MNKKFELLAPGGDIESIQAAIIAGADAVYCGFNHFNARNRATNIKFEDLNFILHLAHVNQCKVFLTINILIIDNEFKSLINLLNKLVNTPLDGVIVQDLGLFYLLSSHFKNLKIHASTQLTTHNEGQIQFLDQLGASQINLCRELNIDEIKGLVDVGHKRGISSEVFVHGSYCVGFSGICYLSSVLQGKSGNRGRCSQQCRDQYLPTAQGKKFPLNLKDNSAFNDLHQLVQAGIDSLKIEGRMKKFHYVYTVVNSWRKLLDQFYTTGQSYSNDTAIYRVFNRTFSNGFLIGDINKNMFIDNPRDSSALYFCETDDDLKIAKSGIDDARTVIVEDVRAKIKSQVVKKTPLSVKLSGGEGDLLQIEVSAADITFNLCSRSRLLSMDNAVVEQKKHKLNPNGLDKDILQQRFETLDESRFSLKTLDLSELSTQLFLPFKEMTVINKKMLSYLTCGHETIDPLELPRLMKHDKRTLKPNLSVLISAVEQIAHCSDSTATIYFQLPSFLQNNWRDFIIIFRENSQLIPWFPAILIGDNYTAAIKLLQQLQPEKIVTNNSGIAFVAYQAGIEWVAGPYLNCINSYTLLCLKEKFNCAGAFISNELSRAQIDMISKPEGFDLYYSIYHPVMLLTSRQCLLQQIEGCEKNSFDEDCIHKCIRTATITNNKNNNLFVVKGRDNYHAIYHSSHFLNCDIVADSADIFSEFLIDLSPIDNETAVELEPQGLIELFDRLLNCDPHAKEELEQVIKHTNNTQYCKGI